MYALISATPSPYARKVRIALHEKAIPFELRTEVPWHGTTATPDHNPLEKLPVLLLPSGDAVYESRFILEWLEVMHPEPPLLPRDAREALRARQVEVVCDGICDATVLLFLERRRELPSEPWVDRQRRKVDGGLRALNAWAQAGLFDAPFDLRHISVGTMLRYLDVRFTEHPWRQAYPALMSLSDQMEQRASFVRTVPVPQSITEVVV